MDNKPVDSGILEPLNKILDLSTKLPEILAYGLAMAVVIVVALVSAQTLPTPVLLLLFAVLLFPLVAFVYRDARQRERLESPNTVVSEIKKGLNRKTFTEPLTECTNENWIERYRGACETYILLKGYEDSIEANGSDRQKDVYRKLIREVDGYRMDLAEYLLERKRFPRAEDGTLSIPSGIAEPVEKHRRAIKDLEEKLVS